MYTQKILFVADYDMADLFMVSDWLECSQQYPSPEFHFIFKTRDNCIPEPVGDTYVKLFGTTEPMISCEVNFYSPDRFNEKVRRYMAEKKIKLLFYEPDHQVYVDRARRRKISILN